METTTKKQAVSLDHLDQQLALSVRQVSALTTLSISFIRDEISGGALAAIRRGSGRGRVLVMKSELKKYLSKRSNSKRQK